MEYRFMTDEGRYDLVARVRCVGDDLLVAIWGGGRPHIGAVSMAQPRASLKDPSKLSATASVFTYVGHKEDMLAKTASETLASALNKKVVVTAGIHWDDMEEKGIKRVIKNCEILVGMIVKEFSSSKS